MTRLSINDLLPDTDYSIRVRAVNSQGVSEWSNVRSFTTISDTVLPAIPQSVTWVVSGNSFYGEWDAVTENEEGDPITVTRYEIEVGGQAITRIVAVAPTTGGKGAYEMTYEINRALFVTPDPSITFRIRAVDNKELKSAWSPLLTATNPAPGAPTMKAGYPKTGVDSINLSWDAPADTDIAEYRVYVGTTAGFTADGSSLAYNGSAQAFNYVNANNQEYFFKIRSVDIFEQVSTDLTASATPGVSGGVDNVAPDVPTSLAATVENEDAGFSATASLTWNQTLPSPDDLAGFYVRYRVNGTTPWNQASFSAVGSFVSGTSYAGVITLPTAYVDYDFQIQSFDQFGNQSAWTATVTEGPPANTNPAQVTGLLSTPDNNAIRYQWTALTDADLDYYELDFSTDSGFTSPITFRTGLATSHAITGLAPETTYYARVRAVDRAGGIGTWSTTDTETTPVSIANGSITDAMIGDVSFSKITAGTVGAGVGLQMAAGSSILLQGGHIRNSTYTYPGQSGSTYIYHAGATAGWYIGDDGIVITDGAIKAEAFIGGTFDAGTINIASGGAIQSADYNGTSLGYRLSNTGLDVFAGRVRAAALDIQVGANILPYAIATMDLVIEDTPAILSSDTNATIAMDDVTYHMAPRSLEVEQTAATGRQVIFATTDTENNIVNAEIGSSYIYSMWIRPTVAGTVTMQVNNGGTQLATATAKRVADDATTLVANTWQRIYMDTGAISVVGFNVRITLPATIATWNMDAVQVERKLSGNVDSKPSEWHMPSVTEIDGGMITTGSITSPDFDPADSATSGWAISMTGEATFSRMRVIGNTILGIDETDLASVIQSVNYLPGSQGWMISADGSAEFRQIVTGSIDPDSLGDGTFGAGKTIELQGAIEAYGPGGQIVGMSEYGFYSYGLDSNGVLTPFVLFPTDGAPNIISGQLEADTLTVNNGADFHDISTFHPESTMALASNTPTPAVAPTVSQDWPSTALGVLAGRSYSGMTQGHNGNLFATAIYNRAFSGFQVTGTESVIQVREFNATTGAAVADDEIKSIVISSTIGPTSNANYVRNGQVYTHGITWVPNFISAGVGAYAVAYSYSYDLYNKSGTFLGTFTAIGIVTLDSNFGWLADDEVFSPTGNRGNVTIGRDYISNRVLLSWRDIGLNAFRVQHYTWGGSALVSGGTAILSAGLLGSNSHLIGLGNFDFGASRYVWGDNSTGTFKTVNSSVLTATISTEAFTRANSVEIKGGFWNTTTSQFESMGADYKRYKYMGNTNTWSTGGVTANWNFKYTWWDNTGTNYETAASPASITLAMNKRARLTVTHPKIPYTSGADVTPNRSRIYRSVAGGAYAYMIHVEQPGQTWVLEGTTVTPGGAIGSGGAAFPAVANPAKITGTNLQIDGSGLVQTNNPVYKMWQNTTQTFSSADVWRTVQMTDFSGGSGFNRGNISKVTVTTANTTNMDVVLVNVAGWYHVSGGLQFINNATGGRRIIRLEKFTGTTVEGTGEHISSTSTYTLNSQFAHLSANGLVYCNVGDRIRLVAVHQTTGSLQTSSGTGYLHVSLI